MKFYELRRFKNSNDKHLAKALSIYSQNIEPQLRTDTNEILYWLDNYNSTFEDKFYLLGLYLNNEIVAFAQFVHFAKNRFVFVDYIVIEKNARKNNTFYEFIEQIKEFLFAENIEYNYIVGEVGYYNELREPTEMTRNLIRLLKMAGFGVLKVEYYQPMLGKSNFESELMSVLMLYPNEFKTIKKETFLMLIDTIYYNHYKRWYDRFFSESEQAQYITRLNTLKNKIELTIKKKEAIVVNGYASLFKGESISKSIPSYSKLARIVAITISFILLAAIIGVIIILLKKKFGIDNATIQLISIVTGVLVLFGLILYYKSDDEPMTELIEKFIKVFSK